MLTIDPNIAHTPKASGPNNRVMNGAVRIVKIWARIVPLARITTSEVNEMNLSSVLISDSGTSGIDIRSTIMILSYNI
ncbi:MAG: hypothetical protein WC593_03870 [Methanoregula sp.]